MTRSLFAPLLRAALIISLAVFLLALIGVGIAAGSRADRCLLLSDESTSQPVTYVLDTERGVLVTDRRAAQTLTDIPSPDGRFRAGFVQRYGETATMTLQLTDAATGSARIVQADIDDASNVRGYDQIAWAQDSSAFAFMWRDQTRRRFLTISGADGVIRHSIPYTRTVPSHPSVDPVIVAGWSGDGAYVVTAEYTDGVFYYHFFTADGLSPQPTALDGLPVITAALAPSGELIAALTLNAVGTPELVITSISGARAPFRLPYLLQMPTWTLNWSPSGEYLAVGRIADCQAAGCANAGWYYDVIRHDGSVLNGEFALRGLGLINDTTGILPGLWVGERWLWIEQTGDSLRLQQIDARTGETRTLIAGVLPNFAGDLFYVPPSAPYQSVFTQNVLHPMSIEPRLIVPYVGAEGVNVDLLDAATGTRRTIVTGADELISTRFSLGSEFWSESNQRAAVAWRTNAGDRAASYLTAINTATGESVTSAPVSSSIWRPAWVDAAHVGYIEPNSAGGVLHLLNLITSVQRELVFLPTDTLYWRAALTPDERTAASIAGDSPLRGTALTLTELGNERQTAISTSAVESFLWSPDGAWVAFVEYVNRRGNVGISSRDGLVIRRYDLPRIAATPLIRFIAWTAC